MAAFRRSRRPKPQQASDVHLVPYRDFTLVRYRIDGILTDVARIGSAVRDQVISRLCADRGGSGFTFAHGLRTMLRQDPDVTECASPRAARRRSRRCSGSSRRSSEEHERSQDEATLLLVARVLLEAGRVDDVRVFHGILQRDVDYADVQERHRRLKALSSTPA